MKNHKNELVKFGVWTRNGIAFCTTWLLIILIAYCHIFNQQQIAVYLLTKMMFFIIGSVLIFNLLFTKLFIKKWTFTQRLTYFMMLYSVYESLSFYWLGLFYGLGTFIQWLIFISIICTLYLICIAIYQRRSKRYEKIYTQALKNYQQQRKK